jgi:predicted thioesterase
MLSIKNLKMDYRIKEYDLASELPISNEDKFPKVFATSRMIAVMEIASARLMKSNLNLGELSVGVGINIEHIAPTLLNEKIIIEVDFLGMKDKLYEFEIKVIDNGGLIGKGTHTRAIISEERLMNGANKRKTQS